jgi:hypothetical protein
MSDSEDEWTSDEEVGEEEELNGPNGSNGSKGKKPSNGKARGNGSGGGTGGGGMVHATMQKLMDKYAQVRGARTVVSQDESSAWTPERTNALRKMLQHFLMHKSEAMKPLRGGGDSKDSQGGIHVSAPRVVDDCVRFTIEPFFPKFDPDLVARIDREIKAFLPGFSFYIGNAAEKHSRSVRLIPSGGMSGFSVTVPTETLQPYFEFRPPRMGDRQILLGFLVLLLALVVAVAYNFYASYSSQGYSLVSGLYETFVALGVL